MFVLFFIGVFSYIFFCLFPCSCFRLLPFRLPFRYSPAVFFFRPLFFCFRFVFGRKGPPVHRRRVDLRRPRSDRGRFRSVPYLGDRPVGWNNQLCPRLPAFLREHRAGCRAVRIRMMVLLRLNRVFVRACVFVCFCDFCVFVCFVFLGTRYIFFFCISVYLVFLCILYLVYFAYLAGILRKVNVVFRACYAICWVGASVAPFGLKCFVLFLFYVVFCEICLVLYIIPGIYQVCFV